MIFNEYERAAEIDEKQKFSVDIMTDGILLARYYKTNGLTKEETQDKIWSILIKLDDCFTDGFKKKTLRDIMCNFDSFTLMSNEPVCFYKGEMDVIQQLESMTLRKVLFALLYIRKASGENIFEAENRDINRICINRINSKSLYEALYELKQKGYMRYTNFKGENKNEIVYPALNVQYTSEPVITIIDKHNIIYYYYQYIGQGKYVSCKKCGRLIPAKGNNSCYCDRCAKIMEKESHKRRNEKYRKN